MLPGTYYLHKLPGQEPIVQVCFFVYLIRTYLMHLQDGWMNGVLGHFYALSRLNWAGDNLGNASLDVDAQTLKPPAAKPGTGKTAYKKGHNCRQGVIHEEVIV